MGHKVAREGFEVAAGAVEEDNIGALARYESPGRHARGLDRPHLEVDAGQIGPHGHSCPPGFTGWDGDLFRARPNRPDARKRRIGRREGGHGHAGEPLRHGRVAEDLACNRADRGAHRQPRSDLVAAVAGRVDKLPVVKPSGEGFVLAGYDIGEEGLVEDGVDDGRRVEDDPASSLLVGATSRRARAATSRPGICRRRTRVPSQSGKGRAWLSPPVPITITLLSPGSARTAVSESGSELAGPGQRRQVAARRR